MFNKNKKRIKNLESEIVFLKGELNYYKICKKTLNEKCEEYRKRLEKNKISIMNLNQGCSSDVVTDGLKHDGGKPRLDLVPPEIIEAVGVVMTHCAEKYGEASYRNVEPIRYRAALMRHICKWLKDPHGKDEDSGLPHLWHIACNVAFLLELDKEGVKYESKTQQ